MRDAVAIVESLKKLALISEEHRHKVDVRKLAHRFAAWIDAARHNRGKMPERNQLVGEVLAQKASAAGNRNPHCRVPSIVSVLKAKARRMRLDRSELSEVYCTSFAAI